MDKLPPAMRAFVKQVIAADQSDPEFMKELAKLKKEFKEFKTPRIIALEFLDSGIVMAFSFERGRIFGFAGVPGVLDVKIQIDTIKRLKQLKAHKLRIGGYYNTNAVLDDNGNETGETEQCWIPRRTVPYDIATAFKIGHITISAWNQEEGKKIAHAFLTKGVV
jgi:hypothetical protein